MKADDFPIEPTTKVSALLDQYPELEGVLIEMAPPFKKLRNPILRRTVAKIASLRQAAAAGRLPVGELVNRLRAEVGQKPLSSEGGEEGSSYFSSQPDWFDRAKIVASIDERDAGDPDKMAVVTVLQTAARMEPTEIVELITSFVPAPGIDVMRGKGYLVWPVREADDLVRTYFSKPANE